MPATRPATLGYIDQQQDHGLITSEWELCANPYTWLKPNSQQWTISCPGPQTPPVSIRVTTNQHVCTFWGTQSPTNPQNKYYSGQGYPDLSTHRIGWPILPSQDQSLGLAGMTPDISPGALPMPETEASECAWRGDTGSGTLTGSGLGWGQRA